MPIISSFPFVTRTVSDYFFSISSRHSGLLALVGILHSASVFALSIGFDVCSVPGIEEPLGGVTLGAVIGELPEDGSVGTLGAAIGGLSVDGIFGTPGI
jgi:hypothetical protein